MAAPLKFPGRNMFDVVTESLFGNAQVVRSLPNYERHVYLTFDDGPHPEVTPRVLDILDEHSAKATFFVVATVAEKFPNIVREILLRGHALGNHSYDHKYGPLFLKEPGIRLWIERSEDILRHVSGQGSVGFRPPNGVITPHLLRASHSLGLPVYLWNCRFFDTVRAWQKTHALKTLRRLESGDILLLHDRQSLKRHDEFLKTLQEFLLQGKKSNWSFERLPKKKEYT